MRKLANKLAMALLAMSLGITQGFSIETDKEPPPPFHKETPAPVKPKPKPKAFHGKLTAMDKAAGTITVAAWRKHVFLITDATKITRDDKPATMDDLSIGDRLVGQYTKGDDGKLLAVVLHLQKGKPEKDDVEEQPKAIEPSEKK